jgi:hypothetical protein
VLQGGAAQGHHLVFERGVPQFQIINHNIRSFNERGFVVTDFQDLDVLTDRLIVIFNVTIK